MQGKVFATLVASCISLLMASDVQATTPNIAVIYSDPHVSNHWSVLAGGGIFNSVTPINAQNTTPTLSELMAFDSVLVWSNITSFQNPAGLGTTLAAYVNAGRGVVTSPFYNQSTPLGGDWASGGFVGMTSGVSTSIGPYAPGIIIAPGHEILAGFAGMTGGHEYVESGSTVINGFTDIYHHRDGKPFVAAKDMPGSAGRVVYLNMFMPYSGSAGSWTDLTEGRVLQTNSLCWAAGANTVDCNVNRLDDPTGVPAPAALSLLVAGFAALLRRR